MTQSNSGDGGQFSINGQRASSNYWTVDGVSANVSASTSSQPGNGVGGALGSFSILGGTNTLVSVDALEEFRVQGSTFAPEFGRTPGGQISIATRSGTSQYHGTLFDYLRNDAFDANNWFNGFNQNPPLPKAQERQNDFGGTFSGPVIRDGTFFFFSYEGFRLRLPQTSLTTVPDVAARQNAIPALQPYLQSYPIPNGADDPASGIAQFNVSYSNPASLDAYSIRIDHRLGWRVGIFGRYSDSPSELTQRGANGIALSNVFRSKVKLQTATVGSMWTISSLATNDFRFNYSRSTGSSQYELDNFGGAVPLTALPFPDGFTTDNAFFQMTIRSLTGGRAIVDGSNTLNLQRQFNIVDSTSIQIGAHSLKFGLDYRRLSPRFKRPEYRQGANFSDIPNAEAGTTNFGFVLSNASPTLLLRNLGIFAQDSWRVGSRLSLTYGIRWDLDAAPSSLAGPAIPAVEGYSLTDFSKLAVAPQGTRPFKTTYTNFAPRVGIAYQVSQKNDWLTVLRGGFGVFYDLVSSETGNLISFGFPPFQANNFALSGAFPYNPAAVQPVPIPPTGVIGSVYAFNPQLKLPYTLEWNIATEQGLGSEQSLSLSYVGAAGRRLLQTSNIISPASNPTVMGLFIDNTAGSDYNALQLQFKRRLSRGLQVLASYTWSHSLDDGSAGSPALTSNKGVPNNLSVNHGPSDFDIRNAFSAAVSYRFPVVRSNTLVKAVLNGWSTENVIFARSALPIDVVDTNFEDTAIGGSILAEIRPDVVPGQPLYLFGAHYPGGKAFNPAAFQDPPTSNSLPVRQGNLGRNALQGFGAWQWDFAVHRDFPIIERLKLRFRCELFNLLNHPNFGPPVPTFGVPGFGVSNQMLGQYLGGGNLGGGGLSPLYQLGGPRSVQFAMKLLF